MRSDPLAERRPPKTHEQDAIKVFYPPGCHYAAAFSGLYRNKKTEELWMRENLGCAADEVPKLARWEKNNCVPF